MDDVREEVPARVVDTEGVREAGPDGLAERVGGVCVLHAGAKRPGDRDDGRGQGRHQEGERDDRERGEGDAVAAQAPPEELHGLNPVHDTSYPRQESNLDPPLRRRLSYPLDYEGVARP